MTRQSREIEELIVRAASRAAGQVQFRALQALASATPVDTGYARSGWSPSIGTSPTQPNPRPETGASSAASQQRAKNQAESRRILDRYRIDLGPIFITNNVPYIVFLNQGSSAQAGAKFVERAIDLAVQSAIALLRRELRRGQF